MKDNRDYNQDGYSATSNPDYKRRETVDFIYQDMNDRDWELESKYYNSYRVNRENIKCRTLKKNDR